MLRSFPPLHTVFSPSLQAFQACSPTQLLLLNTSTSTTTTTTTTAAHLPHPQPPSPSSSTTPLSRLSSSASLPTESTAIKEPGRDSDSLSGTLSTTIPSVVVSLVNRRDSAVNDGQSIIDSSSSSSPAPSISEQKRRKHWSSIPSLLLRLSYAPASGRRSSSSSTSSYSRILHRASSTSSASSASICTPSPPAAASGDTSLPPRGNSGGQELPSGNVQAQTWCDSDGPGYNVRDKQPPQELVTQHQAPSCSPSKSSIYPIRISEPCISHQNRPSSSSSSATSTAPRSTLSRRPSTLRRFTTGPRWSRVSTSHLPEQRFFGIFTSTEAYSLSVPIDALRHLQSISEHDISCKMHQTSSRLLRMTEDERPFTRDFKDLFSTLMVSLPLTPHRVRFQRVDHTFTSEEAITNLGSLKFSQSNRMPDPKDPSRIVTTTTTTTFSMAREMAKSVCQKFLEARFVETVDGKNDFSSKNAVWQLTPKGMHILQRFCNRNGINQRHVQLLLESPRNTMHLVLLERESEGDKLYRDQATIEVVFRRFVGQDGPNLKWSTANSDSDSVTDYQTGLVGVKMARERKVGDKTYWNTFTGKAAVDWLMDCCTMVDRRETVELAGLFVEYGLIHPVEGTVQPGKFSPLKTSIYYVTDKGQRVAGWVPSARGTTNGEPTTITRRVEGGRDSNANRMTVIIRDPALRLLFREFLRDTHCEENLAFYLDVQDFLTNYHTAKRSSATLRLDTIRETLAAAYSLYNAFLAPGSPCELNIDHSLRTALAARMTRAVGDDEATIASLDEVASLFDQAQTSVFKLMASDSVPKFMREPKYAPVIRERNLDISIGNSLASRS